MIARFALIVLSLAFSLPVQAATTCAIEALVPVTVFEGAKRTPRMVQTGERISGITNFTQSITHTTGSVYCLSDVGEDNSCYPEEAFKLVPTCYVDDFTGYEIRDFQFLRVIPNDTEPHPSDVERE